MSTPKASTVTTARLRNVGNGVIEISNDALKFYIEVGRFRKQRKIAREIPFAEISSFEKLGNDLNVVWKDATNVFALEEARQAEVFCEKISQALAERKKIEEVKVAQDKEVRNHEERSLNFMEAAESLFMLLRNLNGRVDWKSVESSYIRFEENTVKFLETSNSLNIELKPLHTAVQERRSRETAEKAFVALKTLYEHYNKLALAVNVEDKNGQRQRDTKMIVHGFYVLNDIALGKVVGDSQMSQEYADLLKTLDELAKLPGWRIDTSSIKEFLEKPSVEIAGHDGVFNDAFSMLGQQLKELLVSVSSAPPPADPSVY